MTRAEMFWQVAQACGNSETGLASFKRSEPVPDGIGEGRPLVLPRRSGEEGWQK